MPAGIELDELIDPTGAVFSLQNGKTRAVLSEEGGGTPPISYLVSRGPLQDGATLRGFRLDPRAYIMLVRWQGCSRDQYWQMRARLLDRVRPNRQVIGSLNPYILRKYLIVNGAQVKRDLYVMIESGPEFVGRTPAQWDENGFSETLRWVAYDPTWYDGSATVITVTPTSTDQLVFPITFPIVFGMGIISHSQAVTYSGTWATYPTLTINGPVGGPSITNTTTGEVIHLDTYTVALGEQVTIDLAYGAKTITNNYGDNLIPYLSSSSDLSTWHLEPAPGAPGGVNTISFGGSGATGSTQFGITYAARYYGI